MARVRVRRRGGRATRIRLSLTTPGNARPANRRFLARTASASRSGASRDRRRLCREFSLRFLLGPRDLLAGDDAGLERATRAVNDDVLNRGSPMTADVPDSDAGRGRRRDQPLSARVRATPGRAKPLLRRSPSLAPSPPCPPITAAFTMPRKKVVSATKGRVPFPAVFFPRRRMRSLAGACQRRGI